MLLLSRTAAYEYLNRVTVAEITSTIRGIPQEVPVGRREGLDRRSVVNFDNVKTIAKDRLKEPIGVLSRARAVEVKRALGYAFDWSELKVLGSE